MIELNKNEVLAISGGKVTKDDVYGCLAIAGIIIIGAAGIYNGYGMGQQIPREHLPLAASIIGFLSAKLRNSKKK